MYMSAEVKPYLRQYSISDSLYSREQESNLKFITIFSKFSAGETAAEIDSPLVPF